MVSWLQPPSLCCFPKPSQAIPVIWSNKTYEFKHHKTRYCWCCIYIYIPWLIQRNMYHIQTQNLPVILAHFPILSLKSPFIFICIYITYIIIIYIYINGCWVDISPIYHGVFWFKIYLCWLSILIYILLVVYSHRICQQPSDSSTKLLNMASCSCFAH